MKTCESCKHWLHAQGGTHAWGAFGKCVGMFEPGFDDNAESMERDGVLAYVDSPWLWTQPTFSCAVHEERT